MIFDGFDMILNGCTTDMVSIYQDKDKRYFQFSIQQEQANGKEEFVTLISRDELVELKTRLDILLELTD